MWEKAGHWEGSPNHPQLACKPTPISALPAYSSPSGPLCSSRVVSIKAPERSYHIFYQLCAGASPQQRQELG